MTAPASLGHAVLHLMDYLGDAAKVAEHLDHEEYDEARAKAVTLLVRRFRTDKHHFQTCAHRIEGLLRLVADGHVEAATQPEPVTPTDKWAGAIPVSESVGA